MSPADTAQLLAERNLLSRLLERRARRHVYAEGMTTEEGSGDGAPVADLCYEVADGACYEIIIRRLSPSDDRALPSPEVQAAATAALDQLRTRLAGTGGQREPWALLRYYGADGQLLRTALREGDGE